MKKILTLLMTGIVITGMSSTYAQNPGDTIVVQTFDYNSTTRDTVANFPDLPGVTYEKVLMQYNMRCHGAAVNTGGGNNWGPNGSNACGEWDYSCNTNITDSSRIDSVSYTQPSHSITGFSGTTFNYSSSPLYDYYQYQQQQVALNNIVSENQYALLAGTTPTSDALAGNNQSGRSQYLYTAAELTGAGFAAGDIEGFLVNAVNGGSVNFLRVKIKGTTAGTLDPTAPETTGFTEVYFSDYTFTAGQNRIQFYAPFTWNGTDNIIIELSFTNTVAGSAVQLEGTTSGAGSGIVANNGYHMNVAASGHIDIPVGGLSTITNEVTVSFWAYGDANQLPANTTIIEGLGAGGERDLNVHLPWSNSRVYWDCGGDGGYDRIDKAAATNEFAGQWNHWAFTKNTTTGVMEMYLNGVLWHSGTGATRPIDIAEMVVGKSATYGVNYKGSIDELRIWDKALSGTDIQNWMSIPLTASHPEYSSLVAYYPFNEGTGTTLTDASPIAASATANTSTVWLYDRGKDLERFFSETNVRPSITLVEGTYNMTVTPTAVLDSVQIVPNTVEEYTIVPNPGQLLDDDILTVSTTQVWEAVTQSIYDGETGALIGTVPTSTDGTINITDLPYYRRWPAKFEILSFVTPYGIGLDLGAEGKTWTFDLTDYLPIMKGPKRLNIERSGAWQEELDVKFLFIVGTPPRDVVDITQVWRVDSRAYGSIINDRFFPPRDVPTNSAAEYFKVRTAVTGHGQEGEFIPQQHTMNINGGATEFQWQVWKECGENPVYPQGGTWVYDRAGWCPGMATDVRHNDITQLVTAGQPVNLDYGVVTAQGDSRYIVNNQLVQYGAANHTLDAAVVEVMEPSKRVEYDRFNSMCNQPKVRIRNTGSTELTSLTISYWVNNAQTPITFDWTGNLAFMAEEEVTLPAPIWLWEPCNQTDNQFHVELSNPNGGTDEYAHNNHYVSTFDIPDVMPDHMIVWFKTNNAPNESSYEIIDEYSGTVIHSRSAMAANTLYKDTIQLGVGGCYVYKVYDTDDDGISWWANNDGSGYTRFQEVGGTIVKAFEPDFGDNINYHFTVDFPLSYEEINDLESVEVHPNPTEDKINVSLRGFDNKVDVQLINHLGQLVYTDRVNTENGLYQGTISMEAYQDGMYILMVSDGKQTSRVKVVKQ